MDTRVKLSPSGPAKAIVTKVVGVGTGAANHVIMTVAAIIVTDNQGRVFGMDVPVEFDPAIGLVALGTAVHDAVVAAAATIGVTIGVGRMLLLSFVRL